MPADVAAQANRSSADKTLSPYFFVDGGDPAVDRLPLKETRVDVAITGVIADVTVRQMYENRGGRPIHARYVFPASTRAAVYGMTMTVGDVRIVARIKERETAKREFETAKREGKSASLLEQSRPNVFTMNVANVLPGDTISVELKYTELLVSTQGVYEFLYPTVVGPR
jgi:Ca-activated chloride channel homolog